MVCPSMLRRMATFKYVERTDNVKERLSTAHGLEAVQRPGVGWAMGSVYLGGGAEDWGSKVCSVMFSVSGGHSIGTARRRKL